jgi:hypothetical protein
MQCNNIWNVQHDVPLHMTDSPVKAEVDNIAEWLVFTTHCPGPCYFGIIPECSWRDSEKAQYTPIN